MDTHTYTHAHIIEKSVTKAIWGVTIMFYSSHSVRNLCLFSLWMSCVIIAQNAGLGPISKSVSSQPHFEASPAFHYSPFSLILPPGSMVGFARLSPLRPGRHSDSCPWLVIPRHQRNGLMTPHSRCCGFHTLVIFTVPAALLIWMGKLMLSNFRLGSTQTITPKF